MPDLFTILFQKWKLIAGLTIAATVLTLIISLLRPKQFGATVTALPANSVLTDKSRIFNNNIESLYPELGSVDELDRIEGTANLDTLYITLVNSLNLLHHYGFDKPEQTSLLKAVSKLKKRTEIRRSEYGELKIKVWDENPVMASQLANTMLQELNNLHRQLRMQNITVLLGKLKISLVQKQSQLDSFQHSLSQYQGSNLRTDTGTGRRGRVLLQASTALPEQIRQLEQLIDQYEVAISTAPQPLIVVEYARPAFVLTKPNLLQTTLFAFAASLLFSFLLAFLLETRKRKYDTTRH